jgi:hypothetical protein
MLVLLLFFHVRSREVPPPRAFFLCLAFGTGSLMLPYAGLMMNHVLIAFLLFAAYFCLSRDELEDKHALACGAAVGLAAISEYLSLPLLLPFALALFWRTRSWRKLGLYLAGPGVFLLFHVGFNYLTYGALFVSTYAAQSDRYVNEGLLFGMLGLPELVRLYWLSFHPFRGLFFTCPVLIIGLLGLFEARRLEPSIVKTFLPACVIGHFLLFNLCFNGWTGGWGVGPRYITPLMPFVFLLAPLGFARFPKLSVALAISSTLCMLVSTSVLVSVPAPDNALVSRSPLAMLLPFLFSGQLSISTQSMLERVPSLNYNLLWARIQQGIPSPGEQWDSYNLGELVGLQGLWSLLPLLLLVPPVILHARRLAATSSARQ